MLPKSHGRVLYDRVLMANVSHIKLERKHNCPVEKLCISLHCATALPWENGLTGESRVCEELGKARRYIRQTPATTKQQTPAIKRKMRNHAKRRNRVQTGPPTADPRTDHRPTTEPPRGAKAQEAPPRRDHQDQPDPTHQPPHPTPPTPAQTTPHPTPPQAPTPTDQPTPERPYPL